ncbi:kinase-like protein [Leucogyrophana mollusca]|uniref:Kinase-like protein n=1 Tax=Leucogyrophana mollusca TaxID=85980 RepID=A0ACB8BBM7_9AGAM|nr:kinase-like protein [Leucogyrophana mollusca]
MVDLLHTLVEDPVIEHDMEALFADALVKLVKRSWCYPTCLVLNNITLGAPFEVIAGGFSEVRKGYIQGRTIAVKQVRSYRSDLEELLKDCAREAIIWSRVSHHNLLPFYGVFYLDDQHSRISLISPWMERGHIGQYLAQFPETDRDPLAMDIAQGIKHLHTSVPTVIHGDLKPCNIFITPSGTACLADFGLAYARDPQRRIATSSQGPAHGGTCPYQAPELLNDEPVSFAGDVYAFACVLYEMYSGIRPFHRRNSAGIIHAVTTGERPARPTGVRDLIWGLIEECWHQTPWKRPSASHIVDKLAVIALPGQRPQHQWDDSFRTAIRGRYPLTDHPLSHFAGLP